jgi:hypothetical protein
MSEEKILIDRALLRQIYEVLTVAESADHSNEYFPCCPLCYASSGHRADCALGQILAEPLFQVLSAEIIAEQKAATRHRARKSKS